MTLDPEILGLFATGFGWAACCLLWAGSVRQRLHTIERWQEEHGLIRERLAKLETSNHELRSTIQALILELRRDRDRDPK